MSPSLVSPAPELTPVLIAGGGGPLRYFIIERIKLFKVRYVTYFLIIVKN